MPQSSSTHETIPTCLPALLSLLSAQSRVAVAWITALELCKVMGERGQAQDVDMGPSCPAFLLSCPGQSGLGKSTLVNTLFKSQVSRKASSWNREEKIPKTVEIKAIGHGEDQAWALIRGASFRAGWWGGGWWKGLSGGGGK